MGVEVGVGNAFSPLQTDTDDDESLSNNYNASVSTVATDNDDFEDYTASINMVLLGSLYDSLSAEERRPIAEPNMIDVQSIRSRLTC